MSRKKDQDEIQNETNEPWEQPIYDTDGEEMTSRSQKRNTKKSNTKFLTIVLILIFLIAAIPISAGVWGIYEKNKSKKPEQTPETTISSTIESSTTSESTSSSTVESSTVESSSEVAVESSVKETPTPPVQQPEEKPEPVAPKPDENQGGEEYVEVLSGEGPNAVAARAGISVEELYRLNGMTPENFHLSPGQQLRVR